MKNEDKGKNKGKLKYIGVVVVVVFLAGIYLASATTVITDIQIALEKVGVGNTKISGGFIEVDDSSGSPIFCVNSTSGNVGIGTADPQGLLQVGEPFIVTDEEDVGISDSTALEYTPDAKLEITTGTNKDFLMISSTAAADGDRFIVKNNGKVGIGTTNPWAKLDICDNTGSVNLRILQDQTGSDAYMRFRVWTAGWSYADFGLTGDTKKLFFNNPWTSTRMVIQSDGNVGIGTTDPDEELHVHKPQNAPTMIHVTNGNNGANAKTGIKLDNSEIFVQHGSGTPYPNSLVIHHNEQNERIKFIIDGHEMMRLQSSPNPPRVCINDVLHLEPRASAPPGPLEGDIYVNSGDNHIYCYLNGAWKQLDN